MAKFLNEPAPRCVCCGCTDQRACEGGCFWVFVSPPICSACVIKQLVAKARELDENARFEVGEQLVNAADAIHPEYDAMVAAAEQEAEEDAELLPKLWVPGDGDRFLGI